jgi:glycogen debranching enzyme
MAVEISVGPPIITINKNDVFMVTDLSGEIEPNSELGVFYRDTRFVSGYKLLASGRPWTRLSSSAAAHDTAFVYLTNTAIRTEAGEIPAGTLSLAIKRAVDNGIHEDIIITNYGLTQATFNLELEVRSDFADLFEVKEHNHYERGHIDTVTDLAQRSIQITYRNKDFVRSLVYNVISGDSFARYVNGQLAFDIDLAPGQTWRLCYQLGLYQGEAPATPPVTICYFQRGDPGAEVRQRTWTEQATTVTSSNVDVERAYRQSVEDMGALRLYRYDWSPDVWVPAAGVPWFVTLFGRDSLIVSLQNMLVSPGFARGALKTLAAFQATELDPWRDAEPGKILHEMRFGELAHFNRIPHTPYYGTADATTLYLTVLHEAWKWLGDTTLLHEHLSTAERCLQWIDQYGDLDGDGFQEYQTRSTRGYENMGWKDAGDAVVYPDGSQVKQPKALCELQGYVFDAWLRMAEVYDALNQPQKAAEFRQRAADLQRRFEDRFWVEELGCYAYGLDPAKQPIKTIASNPGHLLYSGIASPEHAFRVVARFMQPDMWSGWGIRTLSMQNPAYNPFSYQNGSVWPHDNGIIAMGFKRYGFADEAAQVAHDVIQAASYFVSYRLPELYAGIGRESGNFPVQYLGANVPQAWAAGSVFHFLQAMLGLQADAPNGRLTVDPDLPPWLPEITLRGLKVGDSRFDLRFWREQDATRWEVLSHTGTVEIEQVPWRPWTVPEQGPEEQKAA